MEERRYSLVVKAPLFLGIVAAVIPLFVWSVWWIPAAIEDILFFAGWPLALGGILLAFKNKKRTVGEKMFFVFGLSICGIMFLFSLAFFLSFASI